MHTTVRKSQRPGLVMRPILMLLLVGTLLGPGALDRAPLGAGDLAHTRGAGFWSDPCTLDGFAVGAGGLLCGLAASPGGCVTAFVGLFKAIYVDNCF